DSTLVSRRAFHRVAAVVAAVALCANTAELAEASSPGKPRSGTTMKGAVSYNPLPYDQVPGWDQDDHAAAFKAFLQSCAQVLAAARERTATDKVPPPPAALVSVCAAASQLGGSLGKADAK